MPLTIDDRIVPFGADKPIYSAQRPYTRSPTCWASGLDLTCISPWNSQGANKRAGTLISPRHILFAAHYQLSVGTAIHFVAADGTTVTRTITATKTHPDYSPYYPDITIGLLDSDVPASIGFCKVLPDGQSVQGLPALVLDQEEKALIFDTHYTFGGMQYYKEPINARRKEFHETIISGDSGNPCFLVVNDELVLLSVWTYPTAGTSIVGHKAAINTMMADLGGGYQLTEVVFDPPIVPALNPFEAVYTGLYDMLADKIPFKNLVKVGNQIRYDENNRDPIKQSVQAADLPEVILVSDGMAANLFNTSSSSMATRRYSWLISTGDFRISKYLYDVEWAIYCGMTDWQSVLGAITWNGETFVKRAAIVDVSEGLSDAERNRGIQGWSAVWRIEVEMHFKTSDLRAELS